MFDLPTSLKAYYVLWQTSIILASNGCLLPNEYLIPKRISQPHHVVETRHKLRTMGMYAMGDQMEIKNKELAHWIVLKDSGVDF